MNESPLPAVSRRSLLSSGAALLGGAGAVAVFPKPAAADQAPGAPGPAPGHDGGRVGVVNVTERGAAGDGIAFDTAAIQSAVDEAAARGGVVFFPPGHYRLAAPGVRITRPVQLLGSGWEGT
ncbi:MAG TPA: glycosyl hydrolase family 28-related protein, partial [Acidimicrobiia bacterium]|nr:glycosyl hydrolase family 28-related protein [Acidimicrobiia bacterium]